MPRVMSRRLKAFSRARNGIMSESVVATSGGVDFKVELDFRSSRWSSSASAPHEGQFPFVAYLNAKRYEIYSDRTFAEVEVDGTPD